MPITIEFVGVCTHIREGDLHRVVLVSAREERDVGGKGRVPPHTPKLIIDGQPRPLEGMRLEIEGAAGTLTYAENWARMPKLVREPPPFALAEGVRGFGDPSLVDAWLDVRAGHFEVRCHGRAFGARLTVETEAEPHLVMLPLGAGGDAERLALRPDSDIRIEHTAHEHEGDDTNHFLLHYLIAAQIPGYAAGNDVECGGRGGPPSLGPGCSNSDFP